MVYTLLEDYNRNKKDIQIIKDCDTYSIIYEPRVGKKYKVSYYNEYNVIDDNPSLKTFDNLGIKFGNYFEILLNYSKELFNDLTECDNFDLCKFNIGDITVEISHPSLLYDIALKEFDGDKYYSWTNYWTLSLNGITNDNFEEYLVKALFSIRWYNRPTSEYWEPECVKYFGYYDALCMDYEENEVIISNRRSDCPNYNNHIFKDFNHYEALAFYNEGMILRNHEISFLYFYKVLEYFFLICRQEEFETLIQSYNQSNNINLFITKVTDIYKEKEDIQLELLLKSIENELNDSIRIAIQKGIIETESISEFASKLYLYRNNIVHGKSDTKYELKIPTIIIDNSEDFWRENIIKIAEVLIKKYCLV